MNKHIIVGTATAFVLAFSLVLPSTAQAQDLEKVKASMALLKSKAEKLGPPKIEGTDTVADKTVPALYFGSTKMKTISIWLTKS